MTHAKQINSHTTKDHDRSDHPLGVRRESILYSSPSTLWDNLEIRLVLFIIEGKKHYSHAAEIARVGLPISLFINTQIQTRR